jgi:putative transposase
VNFWVFSLVREEYPDAEEAIFRRADSVCLESGTPVGEICRKMGVADATFYRWKKVYAGMGVAEIRRLKQLEEENAKLKRLVADLTLDKTMLQDALRKKW